MPVTRGGSRPYFCSAINVSNGKGCGNPVSTYGAYCATHRRLNDERRREGRPLLKRGSARYD